MSDLTSLRERIGKATGADRELDALIICALRLPISHESYANNWAGPWKVGRNDYGDVRVEWWRDIDDGDGPEFYTQAFPAYTSSLDAALGLVEATLPGAEWEMTNLYGICRARIELNRSDAQWSDGEGATPALALLAALLAALSEVRP